MRPTGHSQIKTKKPKNLDKTLATHGDIGDAGVGCEQVALGALVVSQSLTTLARPRVLLHQVRHVQAELRQDVLVDPGPAVPGQLQDHVLRHLEHASENYDHDVCTD